MAGIDPVDPTGLHAMNGAESLVTTLATNGVEVCFANPGTSEMHFVAALDRIAGPRCVLGLFEGVVTGAADGYYRMAGKPAATLLHLGPGLGNGLANLLTGNAAANVLRGGGGNDTLDGGAGADTLLGGSGNDSYVVGSTGDKVYETTTVGGTTNVVSDRFVQLANRCISASVSPSTSSTTATGLPR